MTGQRLVRRLGSSAGGAVAHIAKCCSAALWSLTFQQLNTTGRSNKCELTKQQRRL